MFTEDCCWTKNMSNGEEKEDTWATQPPRQSSITGQNVLSLYRPFVQAHVRQQCTLQIIIVIKIIIIKNL